MKFCCFDQNLGYVKCDIDGEGYNRVTIYRDGDTYDYERVSLCYGNVIQKGITKDQMLANLEEDDFLVATLEARKQVKDFKAQIRGEAKASPLQAERRRVVAPTVDPIPWDTLTPSVSNATSSGVSFTNILGEANWWVPVAQARFTWNLEDSPF